MLDFAASNSLLNEKKIDALLVTNYTNIFYATGFKGLSPTEREAVAILAKDKCTLITARLYQNEALKLASDTLDVKIASERDQYRAFIKEMFKKYRRFGFEGDDLKFAEHKRFAKLVNGKFKSSEEFVEKLRQIKTGEEVANIKRAQLISQKAFLQISKTVKVGQTEAEISEKLLKIMASLGSQGPSFDPIVASGPNSALPHYLTSDRKIQKGDSLLLDFGAKYKNYCADLSRVIFIGKADNTQRNIYSEVLSAQKLAISHVKADVKTKDVAKVVNNHFKKLKLFENFIHSLGHGIGLEIHESPSLSIKSKDKFQNGMVFSIEPGLYFPWGGVRIEDLFTITNGKIEILGSSAKLTEI